ncbi:MAG: hypothetical protein HY816_03780 [Candidatus Wallbacteria bacterium]|nr:hypothetical protein [Candidatus Wallbacteria bacterium]
MSEFILELRGSSVRHRHVFLGTEGETTLHLVVSASAGGEATLEKGDNLDVDFGGMLCKADLERLAASVPKGFVASGEGPAQGIRLSPEERRPCGDPIEVRVPRVDARETQPNGTLRLSLATRGGDVSTTEYDVTLVESAATGIVPPVSLEWDPATVPRLNPEDQPAVDGNQGAKSAKQSLRFTILNLRCGEDGQPIGLVIEDSNRSKGSLVPRIRLSIPPSPGTSGESAVWPAPFAGVEVTPRSSSGPAWTATSSPTGLYVELTPPRASPEVLNPGAHLEVTLRGLSAGAPGRWSLAVTFVDFPGFVGATFVLPFEVGFGKPAAVIHEFAVARAEGGSAGDWRVSWFAEGARVHRGQIVKAAAGQREVIPLGGPGKMPDGGRVLYGEQEWKGVDLPMTAELQVIDPDGLLLATRELVVHVPVLMELKLIATTGRGNSLWANFFFLVRPELDPARGDELTLEIGDRGKPFKKYGRVSANRGALNPVLQRKCYGHFAYQSADTFDPGALAMLQSGRQVRARVTARIGRWTWTREADLLERSNGQGADNKPGKGTREFVMWDVLDDALWTDA